MNVSRRHTFCWDKSRVCWCWWRQVGGDVVLRSKLWTLISRSVETLNITDKTMTKCLNSRFSMCASERQYSQFLLFNFQGMTAKSPRANKYMSAVLSLSWCWNAFFPPSCFFSALAFFSAESRQTVLLSKEKKIMLYLLFLKKCGGSEKGWNHSR